MEELPKIDRRKFLKKIATVAGGAIVTPNFTTSKLLDIEKNKPQKEQIEDNFTNETIIKELFEEKIIIPNKGKEFTEKVDIWYKRYIGEDKDYDERERLYRKRKKLPQKTIKEDLIAGWQRLLKNDLKTVSEIIKKNNLPIGILFLALAESNWKIDAISRKKARGPWQFISKTAKKFGLRVDKKVDERLDVNKSTEAACEYLEELYSYTESYEIPIEDRWIWAFWAYNRGEGHIFGNDTKEGEFKEAFMDPNKYFNIRTNEESKNYPPKIFGLAKALKEMFRKEKPKTDIETEK